MLSPRLIGRAFLVVFCLWHALAISLTQLPLSTAFGDLHYRIFKKYLAATGTWQHWGMFTSRPYIQTFDLNLRAYSEDPALHPAVNLAPILPGFHEIGENIRLQYLFILAATAQNNFAEEYLLRSCQAAASTLGWKPKAMGMIVRYGYTLAFSSKSPDGSAIQNLEQEYRKVDCP